MTAIRDARLTLGVDPLGGAVDGESTNPHLLHNYPHNAVAYTGTHDNNTTRGWFEALPASQKQAVWNYLRRSSGESCGISAALMRLAWSSPAALAIAPFHDLLGLARMNRPGTIEGNWWWRCTESMLSGPAFDWLRELTGSANRSNGLTEDTIHARNRMQYQPNPLPIS
jgi:4-alpha-glucanotransferase